MDVCGAALNTKASAALSTALALYDMDLTPRPHSFELKYEK